MENGAKLERNKDVYRRYIELLNAQDFDSLPEVVDPERYREICVGFTPGWVNLTDAVTSLEKVLIGIPDLNARIDDLVAEGDKVYARLTVRGTNSGTFYSIPASGGSYEVNMFDYATVEDGRIVERIQQSDTLSQMLQMYGGTAKKAGLLAAGGLVAGSLLFSATRRLARRA
ncbi:MAG: ester cyclase [Rubrobacteraceae bacterium]|nr:ester cyclase [Rubrobacter sp.]